MALGRKQRRFIARSDKRVNMTEGSVRSGKTVVTVLRWLMFIAADAPKYGALVMIGHSRDSLYRNVFEPLEKDPSLAAFAPYVEYRQGASTARIFGRLVHVMGASDVVSEKRIRGMTVAGVLGDEVSTWAAALFRQVLARMSVKGAKFFGTTNPDSPRHWLKAEFLDRARAGELPSWDVWHFDLDDNPGLDPEYRASLEAEYSGLWYQRFIQGLWVAAEGAIFDAWVEARHVLPDEELPTMERILCVGIDYGDTHDTRGYLLGLGPDVRPGHLGEACLYVLSEWAPPKGTQAQRSRHLREWLRAQPYEAWQRPEWVIVDSAAASFRVQLQHDARMFPGGDAQVRLSHKRVLPGLRQMGSLLALGKLRVAKSCTELRAKLPGYVWDEKATKLGNDAPLKQDDDEVDALRYAVYTTRLDWAAYIPITSIESSDDEEVPDGAADE